MSPSTILECAEELCWRAWCTLGVSGVAEPLRSLAIDPEGLIVLSGTVVRDLRLRDELVDWCSQFDRYISISRLKRAIGRLSDPHADKVRELTGRIGRMAAGPWPTNSSRSSQETKLSGKSRLPRLDQPPLTHLHHRAVFGTTSRAEVLLYLRRCSGSVSAAEVAEGVSFGKLAVARTLDELVEGRVLGSSRRGNRNQYTLLRQGPLGQLAGDLPEHFVDWVGWSQLLREIGAHKGKSDRVLAIAIAKIASQIGFHVGQAGDADEVGRELTRIAELA